MNDLQAVFVDVPPGVDADLMAGRRPLERDELPFGAACALARMLLRDAGLGTGEADRGLGFLVRLDALFEKAVVKALRDAGLPAEAKRPAAYLRLGEEGSSRHANRELDCFLRMPDGRGLVIDAKYKSDVSWSNIDQMLSYCHLTGVTEAVLVFPAGQLKDRRAYELRSPERRSVRVALAEFDTSGRSVASWRANGLAFVECLPLGTGPSEMARS